MKYQYVSPAYANELYNLAWDLVTPERFGTPIVPEPVQDYIAKLAIVDGFSKEAKLTRDIYSVLGEDYGNERSAYEEPHY